MARSRASDVDVVVVGPGAVAAATAWQLARDGREVALIDHPVLEPDDGAPVPAVPSRTSVGEHPVRLAAAAVPLWRRVEAETGTALLALTGGVDHGDAFRTAVLAKSLTARGFRHTWLDPAEAAHRWPGMRFQGLVVHQPDRTGRVHTARAVEALRSAAARRGGVVRTGLRVEAVTVHGSDQVVVDTVLGSWRARRVVISAGVESAALAPPEVDLPRLRAVSELLAGFPAFATVPGAVRDGRWPTFVHHTGPLDGWPAAVHGTGDPGGLVVVGFHRHGPVARPPLSRLQDYVVRFLPGLDATAMVAMRRARTESADGRTVLRVHGPVVVGAGFAGRGTALAPALGRELADLAVIGARRPRLTVVG